MRVDRHKWQQARSGARGAVASALGPCGGDRDVGGRKEEQDMGERVATSVTQGCCLSTTVC